MSANARDDVVDDDDEKDDEENDEDERMDIDAPVERVRRPFRRARRPVPRLPPTTFSCDVCGIFNPGRPTRTRRGRYRDCYAAAQDGNLDELKHLVLVHNDAYDDETARVAASANRVDILAWAYCNVGPINDLSGALDVAQEHGCREATELLQFMRLNRYARFRTLQTARHAVLAGGAGDRALKDAMEQIWNRLYGEDWREEEERRAMVFADEEENLRAKELASEMLSVIEEEKKELSNGAYVKLCAALREVYELRVRAEPKSLFDGVLFGPNMLPFADNIYDGHQ